MSTSRSIITATIVCGTLDIVAAFIFGGIQGRMPVQVLQGVASGPLGRWPLQHRAAGAGLGLVTHFVIMAIMVALFVCAARRSPAVLERPLLWGAGYGLLLYGIMYWIVLPLRWPSLFPQLAASQVAEAIFAHVVLVGIPLSVVVARMFESDVRIWR